MRSLSPLLLAWFAAAAGAVGQEDLKFGARVPLVTMPVTIHDKHGRPVESVHEQDVIVYDNDIPRKIKLDEYIAPISLALVVQGSFPPMLDKLRDMGSLIEPLIAGAGGEAALVTFRTDVTVEQPFTRNMALVAAKLASLQASGSGAASMGAVMAAAALFQQRQANRRRVILLIGEASDRGSQTKMGEALFEVARRDISVYALTFSRWLTPFTVKPNADLPPSAMSGCTPVPASRRTPDTDVPNVKSTRLGASLGGPPIIAQNRCSTGDLLEAFAELKRAASPRAATVLAAYSGGVSDGVLRKRGLEDALQRIGEELHTQYFASFTPDPEETPRFHTLRAEVRGRPELKVRTRAGYWSGPR